MKKRKHSSCRIIVSNNIMKDNNLKYFSQYLF